MATLRFFLLNIIIGIAVLGQAPVLSGLEEPAAESVLTQLRVFPAERERARRETLLAILNQHSIPFEERPLLADFGGFGASVFVALHSRQFAQQVEPDEIGVLVLAIPLSNRYEQDFDAELPFDVQTGLAFIEQYRAERPELDVLVAFLGDEVSLLPEGEGRPHLGLSDLFATLENPENVVMLYLDMKKAPVELLIRHGAPGSISARNTIEHIPRLCESLKLPWNFAVRHNELYKLGLASGRAVLGGANHVPANHAGAIQADRVIRRARTRNMNTLYLEAGQGGGDVNNAENVSDTITVDAMAGFFVAYAGSLTINPENFDYHFLLLYAFGKTFIIPEAATLTILVVLLAGAMLALLVYTVIYRKKWIVKVVLFMRFIWVLPLFLLIMILCLTVSGFVITMASRLFGMGEWNDYGRALFKILFALSFFSLFSPLQNALKIPRKAAFYGTAATLLVCLGVFIAAFLDVTFIPLFLSAFLLILAGALIRIPTLVYLCTIFLLCLTVEPFLNVVAASGQTLPFAGGPLADIILSENLLTSLYFSIVILPVMLILERGITLSYEKRNRKQPAPPVAVAAQVSARPAIRRLTRSLAVLLVNLALFTLYLAGFRQISPVEPVRRSESDSALLDITTKTQVFLGRKSVQINVSARGQPLRFDMYLESSNGGVVEVYSAPMPVLRRDSLVLQLGEGPPNPFVTEVVVPANFIGRLRVDALYTTWAPDVDAQPAPTSADYLLNVSKTVTQ